MESTEYTLDFISRAFTIRAVSLKQRRFSCWNKRGW